MRIGVTADFRKSIWNNGINQNAIYLVNLFRSMGHSAHLIYSGEVGSKEIEDLGLNITTIDTSKSFDVPYDVIISVGFSVEKSFISRWKKKKSTVKLVQYECGNKFLTDAESILFNAHSARVDSRDNVKDPLPAKPDQIWSIPQMENTNLEYYKFIHDCEKATVVPFVWEPIVTEKYRDLNDLSDYSPRTSKRIAVMEPNISVFKHVLMPIVIASKYVKEGNELDSFAMFGANIIKDRKRLMHILKDHTPLLEKKLVSAESRLQTLKVLTKYADYILSWQWENALNYLYFDAAWHGYPIIHNAHMCKDVGYYYEGFNASEGKDALQRAIATHAENHEEYKQHNRDIIKRYTSENQKLKEQYETLLQNLVKGKFTKFSYDPASNSIV